MGKNATVFQNQVDSVGALFQADQQTFIYQASAAPARMPLHASLRQLDRVEQIEQLVEIVEAARFGGRSRPLVVVLNGLADDELLSFVQRLAEESFETDMLLPCDYLGNFDWPQRSLQRTVMQLINAISRKRAEPVPLRADAETVLSQLLANHDRSIAFAHVIDPDVCRRDLLQAWGELITERCSNPGAGLLICFLCIQRPSSLSVGADWIDKELAALSQHHGWCLLDALAAIRPRHLEDWITQYNLRPALSDLDHIDPRLTESVFGPRDDLRYREVITRVLELLGPLLKPLEPRWAAQ